MTKKEVMQLIFIIKAAYPRFYSAISKEEITYMHEAWSMVLSDYSYEMACAGVQAYISTDKKGFPPSPGEIIDRIQKMTATEDEKMTEGEAWRLVYRAICNGIYGAAEEFAKLPELCQRAVGSPEVLRQWAQEDIDSMSVIQSNFERSFRTTQERHAEEKKLPGNVRELLGKITDQLQITGGEGN